MLVQFQIMGACFQAPHAAPGQRLMETYLGKHKIFNNFFISLSFSSVTVHCSLQIIQHIFTDVLDGLGIELFGASYNISLK